MASFELIRRSIVKLDYFAVSVIGFDSTLECLVTRWHFNHLFTFFEWVDLIRDVERFLSIFAKLKAIFRSIESKGALFVLQLSGDIGFIQEQHSQHGNSECNG